MGTNFYFADRPDESDNSGVLRSMDTRYHIGKRSAAGLYCWDCGVSLCKGRVHYDDGFYDKCPKCGKKRKKETIENSSAGRELGFNRRKPKPKRGVCSCSSFTWATDPMKTIDVAIRGGIVDEYGSHYTLEEFDMVLKECPIQFFDSIGKEFS
jgi:hypothetical protein